jgi:predicted Zn-dependent peptidase
VTATALQPRPEPGTPRVWAFPDVRRIELRNGMAGLLCHLPTRPVVAVHLILDIPRELEPAGLDGVAAITATALREGTATRDAEAFSEALESRGATLGAHAGEAGVRVVLGVPVSRLEPALELATEAVSQPAFPEREIERLVQQRLDAIALEQADPGWRCGERMMAAVFDPAERVARPGEGTAATVSNIDRAAVVDYWERRARPATATVVVAGDLDGLDIEALLDRTVGAWNGEPAEPPARTAPRTGEAGQAIVVHRPGAVQTELRLARPGPNRQAPTWALSQLGAFALGGTMSSRLMQKLREEKGYTYGIHASVSPLPTTGLLTISTAVETAVTAPAIADVLAEVRRLVDAGITDAEREFAADAITSGPRRMESAHQLAGALSGVVEERLPDDFIPRNLERLEAATTQGVTAQSAKDWQPEGLSLIAVGDADAIAGPLRDAGFSGLRVES